MEEDEDLGVGEFGIATRMVQPDRPQAPAPPPDVVPQARPSATKIYRPHRRRRRCRPRWPRITTSPARRPPWSSTARAASSTTASSSSAARASATSAVDDPNVSRRHAEIRHEDGAYWLVDLGSTNGVTVNGKRVERARLVPEDEILIGTTDVRFERGY